MPPTRWWRRLACAGLVAGVVPLCAGCGAGTTPSAATRAATTTQPARSTSTTTSTTVVATTTTTTVPTFSSSVSGVTATELGATWHAGCPVDPGQLVEIQMSYWGFDNQPHAGAMVVNSSVASAIVSVFSTLYADRFPIQEMVPESAYGGDDNAAAAADDTSGFNCRDAVAPGPPQWSMHAYGEAVDVNDLQNPYIDGSTIIPPAGVAYENRSDVRPGMAEPGGQLVDAFSAIGWGWGGVWTGGVDYQHFSINGR